MKWKKLEVVRRLKEYKAIDLLGHEGDLLRIIRIYALDHLSGQGKCRIDKNGDCELCMIGLEFDKKTKKACEKAFGKV
jgi:hypothetical protein